MTKGNEFDYHNTNYEDGALQQEHNRIVQTNLITLPERYWKAALDPSPKALWEQIGVDLSSSSEEVRMIAFTAFYIMFPALGGHLMDALDEWETRHEGWRHERGKDQSFVNANIDILSLVYIQWVKEGSYQPTSSKDPRPYATWLIKQRWKNQYRKDQRLAQYNEEEWNTLVDTPPDTLEAQLSVPSAEDEALHRIDEEAFDTFRKELIQADYLKEQEFDLACALSIEEWRTDELALHLGVKSGAIRQRKSVYTKKFIDKFIWRRDHFLFNRMENWRFMSNDFMPSIFPAVIGLETFISSMAMSHNLPDWFIKRIEEAMKPALRVAASLDGSEPTYFPLTCGIGRRPGLLYLFDGTADAYKLLHNHFSDQDMSYCPTFVEISRELRPHQYGHPTLDKITYKLNEHCIRVKGQCYKDSFQGGTPARGMLVLSYGIRGT